MDEPRGYYGKWNKSDREGQIPYDFTYMWKSKEQNKWTKKQKQTHGYGEQTHGCQMGGDLWGEKGGGIKKYSFW